MEAIKRDISLRDRNNTNRNSKSRSLIHRDSAKQFLAFLAIQTVFPLRKENLEQMEMGRNLYKRENDEGWWLGLQSRL